MYIWANVSVLPLETVDTISSTHNKHYTDLNLSATVQFTWTKILKIFIFISSTSSIGGSVELPSFGLMTACMWLTQWQVVANKKRYLRHRRGRLTTQWNSWGKRLHLVLSGHLIGQQFWIILYRIRYGSRQLRHYYLLTSTHNTST